jgi:polyisoprenoid-binding protein YceI
MRLQTFALAIALATTMNAPLLNAAGRASDTALTVTSARVTLNGTSNIHEFSASTTTVRLVAVALGNAEAADPLDEVLNPGGLAAFEVAIPAASLTSSKEDLDKNMHKALKVQEHRDIRFRFRALEKTGDAYRGLGWLTIAGVEKEVALTLQVERKGAALAVTGATDLLMTDYGITPPKAMLGMLKTNPKVQIRIELLLGSPLTT